MLFPHFRNPFIYIDVNVYDELLLTNLSLPR
jgi:hypothetical protein